MNQSERAWLKHIIGSHLRVSDLISLGWGQLMCVSNNLSGDADAAGLGEKHGRALLHDHPSLTPGSLFLPAYSV